MIKLRLEESTTDISKGFIWDDIEYVENIEGDVQYEVKPYSRGEALITLVEKGTNHRKRILSGDLCEYRIYLQDGRVIEPDCED